jgi:lysine-N-methylase
MSYNELLVFGESFGQAQRRPASMTIPVRNLPVAQHWDCHACGDCCRRFEGVITGEEKRRIEALDLANDAAVAPRPWFAPAGRGSGNWKLRHRPDGGCVFLTANNHCRLQERFGADVKPFVCRLFPFLLIPAGDHWRVGMRFSCPSAAANQGRPVAEAEPDLVHLSRLLEHHVGRSADSAPAPLMQTGEPLPWPDACRVVDVLVEIVQDRRDPLERRLRQCLAVARVCGQTRLDALQGPKLTKFVQAVRNSVDADVPRNAAALPPPDPLFGMVLFRVLLAIYARRDRDVYRAATSPRRGLGRVLAGWRFARGRGRVPRVNEFLPDTRFEELEQGSPVPPEVEAMLERYYVVKLNSLQFCGPPNFNLPFWPGLESLVLTLPMILWLRRACCALAPANAAQQAVQLVDDHFGGNAMLRFPHIQYLMRLLAQRGELDKLVAWYSR